VPREKVLYLKRARFIMGCGECASIKNVPEITARARMSPVVKLNPSCWV
jgi:hypothetical protein